MAGAGDRFYQYCLKIARNPESSPKQIKAANRYLHKEDMRAMKELLDSGVDLSFAWTPEERERFEIESLKRFRERT